MKNLNNPARSAGVLLHPTSLPGPFGIGDLGPSAYSWIDNLAHARQKWWQILPLGPTGYADSPYQAFSAFAGNSFLISPHLLVDEGLIDGQDLTGVFFPNDRVDFEPAIDFKIKILAKAWDNFQGNRGQHLKNDFEKFKTVHENWLPDYSLFMSIKDHFQRLIWTKWPAELMLRDPKALEEAKKTFVGSIGLHQFRQFLFRRQWDHLRSYAHQKGIRIIGDIPIFVSSDSADVWANPGQFLLDSNRVPTVVAGVPPDYFSATGQLWGNPLYNWAAMEKDQFQWWTARLKSTFDLVDMVRLDHFRGFESYWEIPASAPDARTGTWVKAPGSQLLTTIRQNLGRLPIIAEDLGVITPEVDALRLEFQLPGMRVLQFAFENDPTHRYLPHNYDSNTVVYTGTHDNDTTKGWYSMANDGAKDHVRRYLGRDGSDVAWDMIRAAWSSVADYAITPLQDILNLGSEARMNIPGKPAGNWGWRFQPHQLNRWLLDRLGDLTVLYGRG